MIVIIAASMGTLIRVIIIIMVMDLKKARGYDDDNEMAKRIAMARTLINMSMMTLVMATIVVIGIVETIVSVVLTSQSQTIPTNFKQTRPR